MPGTETNYTPTPYGTFSPPAVICIHGNCVGNGSPSNDFGHDGYTYIDESSDTLWIKTNGSWIISAGGGGGATQVFRSTSDPSGSPGVSAAVHYRTDTGQVWFWSGSAWDQVIG